MKNRIYIVFIFLLTAFAVSCDDYEMDEFTGPYRLSLAGPESVAPGDEEEYTIGDIDNPESYTWTVTGPATITSGTTGNTVMVEFQEQVGDVTLSVTNGVSSRDYHITVENVEPEVSVEYNNYGALMGGASDTVFFSFAAPLAKDPELLMNEDISDFMSGTLGDLIMVDAQNYYAIYTAGEGNGTPEAMFRNIIAASTYGSDTLDSVMVQLYRVDNVAPVANVSYSEQVVNDSTVVTVTVNFSEAVTFADRTEPDSALYITFSGAGVEAERDTLVQSEDDPLMYTYEYTVNGEGNGMVDVEFENIRDLAGHPLNIVNYESELMIDNFMPVVNGTAIDQGSSALISISANEAGTGMYLVLESDEVAPEDVAAFMEMSGVASGSLNLSAIVANRTTVPLPAGDYEVYYLAQDRAGNYSNITSSMLTIE